MTATMKLVPVFIAGFLFALGLGIGGMLDPARVVGFLDFFGGWDPTLAFVMGGALVVNVVAYRISAARGAPMFGDAFHLPLKKQVTMPLVVGSILFGIGWSMAGYCPGPAITNLASGTGTAILFVLAMGGGSFLAGLAMRKLDL